ncbi:MAG: glycosyltransferase 87 family protein [Thermoleophilaceae bacterium]
MDVRAPALAALAALVLLLLAAAPAGAQGLTTPESLTQPPQGFELTGREAVRISERTPEVRAAKERHPGLDSGTYTRGPGRWQISWFAGDDEVVQVHVSDSLRAVLETWTGPQVAWRMARGYEGAFGRTFNAPYVWVTLGLLFLIPFIDPRRPFRLLHLDLLVMVAFAVSHVYFNRGEISTSVPLAYPVLAYLLARMLWVGFRPRERARPLVPLVPVTWLALALIFLVGFRIALNVTDSNVIDVGYSGVVGADQIADGEGLYDGTFPENNRHGDTYGPVNYLVYVPFEQAIPWSGAWDGLPAAHGAAILFDLLVLGGLFLLGRRLRAGPDGRRLGIVLAYAWAAYPYSLFVLSTNANDSLLAALVVFALIALTLPRGKGLASGAALALGAASKFGAGSLAPLFAGGSGERRGRHALLFALAFAAVMAAAFLPFVPDGGLRELYDRTVGYQAGRGSPFSIWGQEEGLGWLQTALQAAVVALALALFFVPRRRDPRQLAALAAAVLIALQLTLTHWFYLYVVWFAPLVLVALFAAHRAAPEAPAAPRDEQAPAAVAA